MTNEQKEAIRECRENGFGYKKTSRITGVCENTVKTFCRRNGLGGNARKDGARKTDVMLEKNCKCCGKSITQYPGRREKKFCSDTCRNKWWNSHLDQAERKAMDEYRCPVCGQAFRAYGTRNRKYCSHACYIRARFGGAPCS